jgi:ABC-type uncharacterized transport system substrate-binding protein
MRMNRRDTLARFGAMLLLGTPFATIAQSVKSPRRIGSLGLGVLATPKELREIWAPARELGWVEGQNLFVERRWTTDPEKLQPYAEELVRLDVQLILTNSTAATIAAKNATSQIPIVFIGSAADPISSGLVADLARPGGNVTGYSSISTELSTKRIEVLRELFPSARRVGVLIHPPSSMLREIVRSACLSSGLEPVILEIASAGALENAIIEATRQRTTALLVHVGSTTAADDAALMRAALKYSLPTIASHKAFVELGGLVSLMPDETEQYRVFAYYLDKILRGTKPSDLPVQRPTRFVLSVNLKTAKALGVTIPASLLARADQVIE